MLVHGSVVAALNAAAADEATDGPASNSARHRARRI